MFDQNITIISTYYNEPELLDKALNNYIALKQKYDNIKFLVVDDGSAFHRAIDVCNNYNLKDFNLYQIDEDLGFNSHGARNLAMQQSSTYWNLLIDIDQVLHPDTFEVLNYMPFQDNDVYALTTNTIVINKQCYFSCKGYDEEFVNVHYGDREFLNYLRKKYNYMELKTICPTFLRSKRKVYIMNIKKTMYDTGVLYQPKHTHSKLNLLAKKVRLRYKTENFNNKEIIKFKWTRLI